MRFSKLPKSPRTSATAKRCHLFLPEILSIPENLPRYAVSPLLLTSTVDFWDVSHSKRNQMLLMPPYFVIGTNCHRIRSRRRSEFLRALVPCFSGGSCPRPFPGHEVRFWWHSGPGCSGLSLPGAAGALPSPPAPRVVPTGIPRVCSGDKLSRLCCSWNTWEPPAAASLSLGGPGSSVQGKPIARGLI